MKKNKFHKFVLSSIVFKLQTIVYRFFIEKIYTTEKIYSRCISTQEMPDWVNDHELKKKKSSIQITTSCLVFNDSEKMDKSSLLINRCLFLFLPGIFLMCLSLFFLLTLAFDESTLFVKLILGILFCIIPFIVSFCFLLKGIYYSNEKIIFDRLNNTVTLPSGFLNLKEDTIKIPFESAELKFDYGSRRTTGYDPKTYNIYYSVRIKSPYLYRNKVFKVFNYTYSPSYTLLVYAAKYPLYNIYESFFTWYMDRNRTLPPGKIFDQYRFEDEKRREQEGLLEPLYKSNNVVIEELDPLIGKKKRKIQMRKKRKIKRK